MFFNVLSPGTWSFRGQGNVLVMCEPIRLQEILYPVLVMARTVIYEVVIYFLFKILFRKTQISLWCLILEDSVKCPVSLS